MNVVNAGTLRVKKGGKNKKPLFKKGDDKVIGGNKDYFPLSLILKKTTQDHEKDLEWNVEEWEGD